MNSTVTNASAPTETGWQRFQRDRTQKTNSLQPVLRKRIEKLGR